MAKKNAANQGAGDPVNPDTTGETAKPKTARKAAKKAATRTKSADEVKPAAKKPAAKKAATKRAATTATADPKSPKPAAKKVARKPAAAAPSDPTPAAPAPINGSSAESGVVAPARKRPAVARPTASTSLVASRASARAAQQIVREVGSRELPNNYGQTNLTVLVRDTEWLFAFWEISPATRDQFDIPLGRQGRPLVLRLYDMTATTASALTSANYTDIAVSDFSNSWYLRAPEAGRTYLVELGILNDAGAFNGIVRSGRVTVPALKLSQTLGPAWDRSANDEARAQILQMSGGMQFIERLGSEELVNSVQRRLLEDSSSWSGGLFSGSLFAGSSESPLIRREAPGPDRGFWLEVGVDVIVYGATDPAAKVTLMGRPVRLNPDGTFRLRMALPDGKIEFPVEATSPDEVETRRVCPVVERWTV